MPVLGTMTSLSDFLKVKFLLYLISISTFMSVSESYLEVCQTSKIEVFPRNING